MNNNTSEKIAKTTATMLIVIIGIFTIILMFTGCSETTAVESDEIELTSSASIESSESNDCPTMATINITDVEFPEYCVLVDGNGDYLDIGELSADCIVRAGEVVKVCHAEFKVENIINDIKDNTIPNIDNIVE